MGLRDTIPSTPADLGNTTDALADIFQDDLLAMKAQLEERNIKIGEFLGAGSIGVAYKLETMDGKPIDSAIIRLEPEGVVGAIDNPAAVKPVFQIKNESFAATIVPKAEKREFSADEIKQSLEVLNAGDKLPYLTDMKPDQFMAVPGIDTAVLTDLSSMKKEPAVEGGRNWAGNAQELADIMGLDYEAIKQTKASPELMTKLAAQQVAVDTAIRAEMTSKGVDIETVPSRQQVVEIQPGVETEQARANTRG